MSIGCSPSETEPAADPGTKAITELSGDTMGTQWRISLGVGHNRDSRPALQDLQREVEDELAVINRLMSTWDADSELSRFNRSFSTETTALHEHTLTVLEAALSVSAATFGAYDVTRGNLFTLWGFGASEPRAEPPSMLEINEALAGSGWQQLVMDDGRVQKRLPQMTVDLSSLAKGFAVDRLGRVLQHHGIRHYIVNIGGEIEVRGERSPNVAWRIGVERPDANASAPTGLQLNHANLATSGSYRNVRFVDGKRISHLIDGRSGRPIDHDLVAVTLLHDNTMLADAWSTALMVAGADWSKRYAVENGLAVHLTMAAGANQPFRVWTSPTWQELKAVSAD